MATSADKGPFGARRDGKIAATLTSGAVGAMAGGLAGLAWGGVGGRIAMRVLLLTSPDYVRGLVSDDGFEMGRFSPDTIALLILTAILGGLAGFLYGLIRMVLRGPQWVIAIGLGIALAAGVGGGVIVNAEGNDFRLLKPLWLAVSMFMVIPGAWGVTVVLLTERLLQPSALFPKLPARINERYWGATGSAFGWMVLAAMAGLGITDLVRDVAKLT